MGKYTNHCNLLDLCAISIPSEEAAEVLPFGITLFSLATDEAFICGVAELFEKKMMAIGESALIAVCGLHMRGYPLESQMNECGGILCPGSCHSTEIPFY
jgi:allophanate hydrolase